jgi:hypothetical protein
LGGLFVGVIVLGLLSSAQKTNENLPTIPELVQAIAPPPSLPPPVLPERPPAPVQGVMRVDVTQTSKTVDVFIVLSEEAKFIVEKSGLLDTPIEQNFEGLKKHMADFADDYDFETGRTIDDPRADTTPWTTRGMIEKEISKQTTELANIQRTAARKAGRKYELEDEIERYKDENTVRLKAYLNNPYRKVVSNALEATAYINRLEKEYLPKIKSIIDASSPAAQAPRSYDF